MRFLIALLVNGLLVYAVAGLMSGVYVEGYVTAIIVALLLAVVNTFVKPLVTAITLPISILTLGLFLLVINGAMILLVDLLMNGFRVDGWGNAIIFSIILTIFNLFTGGFSIRTRDIRINR